MYTIDNIDRKQYGDAVVENEESFLQYAKKMRKLYNEPHKSGVDETWELTLRQDGFIEENKLQEFRLHNLRKDVHKFFPYSHKMALRVDSFDEAKFIFNSFELNLSYDKDTGKDDIKKIEMKNHLFPTKDTEVIEKKTLKELSEFDDEETARYEDGDSSEVYLYAVYVEEDKKLHIRCSHKIPLTESFTAVRVEMKRLSKLDDSYGMIIFSLTYMSHYSIILQGDICFGDCHNGNSLDASGRQTHINKKEKVATINTNGWQFPGLIFVFNIRNEKDGDSKSSECILENKIENKK